VNDKSQKERIMKQERDINHLQQSLGQVMGRLNNLEQKPSSSVFDDVHIWKVYKFNNKFDRAKEFDEQPLFRCFYTSKGHKLKMCLYLDGFDDELGESTSIGFQTEDGSFDDTIRWPMRASISACVIGEDDIPYFGDCVYTNENNYCFKRNNEDSIPLFIGDFIPQDDIYDYIVNDILTIKVTVEYM